jgi:CheY-like chemotaxis protein
MQEIETKRRQKPFQRIAVVAVGCALMLGGIIGLFLPFVPGVLLMVAGVLMLSPRCAWLGQALEQCRARLSLLGGALTRFSSWCEGLRNRLMNHRGDSESQSGAFRRNQTRGETPQSGHNAEALYDPRKVLIFDEDPEDLARHAEPFEAHGFEVYKCMSIETVMRCVEREEFDFALVDQVSPAFEGLRVIRHLVRYNLRTPFVVVARCKDTLCYQQALALGAMDYLEKPVPGSEMNWLIDHYFGNSVKK